MLILLSLLTSFLFLSSVLLCLPTQPHSAFHSLLTLGLLTSYLLIEIENPEANSFSLVVTFYRINVFVMKRGSEKMGEIIE